MSGVSKGLLSHGDQGSMDGWPYQQPRSSERQCQPTDRLLNQQPSDGPREKDDSRLKKQE